MPPARGKAKRTGAAVGPSKAEVKPNDLEDVMKNLLDNQRAALNSSESHVDVVLILQDGVIPVHGVLLEAASPFFMACFESQGPYYFGTREVILPDYKMKTMQKVIQLIYNQSVYCQKESETKDVEEAIKDLGIKLTSSLETVKVAKQEDQKEVKVIAPIVYQCVKEQKTIFKQKSYMNSNGKATPIKEVTIDMTSPTNRGMAGQAIVPRPRVPLMVPRIQPRIMPEESSSSEDSKTDTDIKDKDMSRSAWIIEKAKHCQKCKKDYPTAGEASTCLTSHNRLRCYFCFRVCKNTEMLFQHFGRAHRKGGREGFVVCPCCEQSIPFKAVSCHVISMHLTEGKKSQPGRANYRYRPVYKTPRSKSDNNGVAAKKPKLDELKVGDLDCTFRMEREDGNVWVFNVKKGRDYE